MRDDVCRRFIIGTSEQVLSLRGGACADVAIRNPRPFFPSLAGIAACRPRAAFFAAKKETAQGDLFRDGPLENPSLRPKGEPPGSPFGFPLQGNGGRGTKDEGRGSPHQSALRADSFPQGKPDLRGEGRRRTGERYTVRRSDPHPCLPLGLRSRGAVVNEAPVAPQSRA